MNIDLKDIPFEVIEKYLSGGCIYLEGKDEKALVNDLRNLFSGGIFHLKANLPFGMMENILTYGDFSFYIDENNKIRYSNTGVSSNGDMYILNKETAQEIIRYCSLVKIDTKEIIPLKLLASNLPSYLWFHRTSLNEMRNDPLCSIFEDYNADIFFEPDNLPHYVIIHILRGIERYKDPLCQTSKNEEYQRNHLVAADVIFNYQPSLIPAKTDIRHRTIERKLLVDNDDYQKICANYPIILSALQSLNGKDSIPSIEKKYHDQNLTIRSSDGIDMKFSLDYFTIISETIRDLVGETKLSEISISVPYSFKVLNLLNDVKTETDSDLLAQFDELIRYFSIDEEKYDPLLVKFLNLKFPDLDLYGILEWNYSDSRIRHQRVKLILEKPKNLIYEFCYFYH